MLEQPENQAVRAAQFTWAEEVFHEGEKRGEHKGGILTLCEVLNIELTPERRARLEQLDLDHLSALLAHLKSHRAWPDN